MNLFPKKIRSILLPSEIAKQNREEEIEKEFRSDSEYDESEIETVKKVVKKPAEISANKNEILNQVIQKAAGEILFGESSQQEHEQEQEQEQEQDQEQDPEQDSDKEIPSINAIIPIDQHQSLVSKMQLELHSSNINNKGKNDGSSNKEKSSLVLWSTDDDNLKLSRKFQVNNILPYFYDMNILQAKVESPEFLEGKFYCFFF